MNAQTQRLGIALASGLLFGVGLDLSGMTQREKVLGFLDVLGAWDPSLALVMVGAIAVGTLGFIAAKRRKTSLVGDAIAIPTRSDIDLALIAGSVLFGIGWGLVGLCPGPAFVSLGLGQLDVLTFLVAMLGGALFVDLVRKGRTKVKVTTTTKPTA